MEIRSHVPNENYKAGWERIFGSKTITESEVDALLAATETTVAEIQKKLPKPVKSWTDGKKLPEIMAILAQASESKQSIEDVAAGEEWKKRLEVPKQLTN